MMKGRPYSSNTRDIFASALYDTGIDVDKPSVEVGGPHLVEKGVKNGRRCRRAPQPDPEEKWSVSSTDLFVEIDTP
jgi:hypothetical protein